MAQRREDLRAADKDRESVAEQLRHALDEGRLTLSEYDERLQQTYAARTYGDLDGILDDLPGVVPVAASQVVPVGAGQVVGGGRRRRIPPWLAPMWGSWLTTTLVVTVIWVATGAHYFWPIWVFGPWGAVLLARTLGGLASGGPSPSGGHPSSGGAGDSDERQDWHQEADRRRRAAREQRRQARDRYRSDPS